MQGQRDLDLVVLADPADAVAAGLARQARQAGYAVAILDLRAAAQLYTVSIDRGRSRVEPDRPLFLRVPPPPLTRAGFTDAFQDNERLAVVWAAAALSRAPVINRPTLQDIAGGVVASAWVTERRAGYTAGLTEVFAAMAPAPAGQGSGRWYIQDAATGAISQWPARPGGQGPYRARWAPAAPTYEQVIVVGTAAWRCSTAAVAPLALEEWSVALLRRLRMTFGAVIWSVERMGAEASARVARITAWPTLETMRLIWPQVRAALLAALLP